MQDRRESSEGLKEALCKIELSRGRARLWGEHIYSEVKIAYCQTIQSFEISLLKHHVGIFIQLEFNVYLNT